MKIANLRLSMLLTRFCAQFSISQLFLIRLLSLCPFAVTIDWATIVSVPSVLLARCVRHLLTPQPGNSIFIFQFSIFNSPSPLSQVLVFILNVVLPVLIDPQHFLIGHLAAHFCRRAHYQGTRWYRGARCDQRTGSDKRFLADCNVVQYDSSDSNQTAILDRAAVQHYGVTYGYAVADDRRKTPLRYVNDCAVLYVCAVTDFDVIAITSQDAVEPNARVLADVHIADDAGAFRDERCPGNLWADSFVRSDHRVTKR